MKRTALKRGRAPLPRHVGLRNTTPIPQVSRKRRKALNGEGGYIAFSKALRAAYPRCQIEWPLYCTGASEGVHHVIKRSAGGALKPGDLADEQGQVFLASCNPCNRAVEDNPIDARLRGLVKDNPITPGTLQSKVLRTE